MKVTPADLAIMREKVEPLDTEATRERYRSRNFPRAELVKDLNRRYRFDLLYTAKAYQGLSQEYTDAHLDTALRSIVKPLEE